jgi:hypothetical protein
MPLNAFDIYKNRKNPQMVLGLTKQTNTQEEIDKGYQQQLQALIDRENELQKKIKWSNAEEKRNIDHELLTIQRAKKVLDDAYKGLSGGKEPSKEFKQQVQQVQQVNVQVKDEGQRQFKINPGCDLFAEFDSWLDKRYQTKSVQEEPLSQENKLITPAKEESSTDIEKKAPEDSFFKLLQKKANNHDIRITQETKEQIGSITVTKITIIFSGPNAKEDSEDFLNTLLNKGLITEISPPKKEITPTSSQEEPPDTPKIGWK